jgi:hypothetical protein
MVVVDYVVSGEIVLCRSWSYVLLYWRNRVSVAAALIKPLWNNMRLFVISTLLNVISHKGNSENKGQDFKADLT